jgi:ribosomal protein L24
VETTTTTTKRRPCRTKVRPLSLISFRILSNFIAEFLDDDEDLDFENWNRPPQIEDEDDLHAVAAEYERRAKGYRKAMDIEASDQWEAGREESESEGSDTVSDPEAVPENEFKTLQTVREIQAAHKVADVAARDQPVEGLSFVWHRWRKQVGFAASATVMYFPRTDESKSKMSKLKGESGMEEESGTAGESETEEDHVLERVNFKKARKQRHYPEVTPTPVQRQLFAGTSIPLIRRLKFQGPSPALAEGDRVVALAGRHSGTNGYIVHLREIWDKALGARVLWAKVVPPGADGAYEVKTKAEATYIRVRQLRRSILDLPYTFQRNDRVRVLGEMYQGVCGRVVEINGALLTIAIPRDVTGQETIAVPMRFVTRDWHLGDSVRVRWGGYTGRRGFIVHMASGVLTIFDVRVFPFSFCVRD